VSYFDDLRSNLHKFTADIDIERIFLVAVIRELSELTTKRITCGAEVVVALTGGEARHGPDTPFFTIYTWAGLDATPEHKVTRRTVNCSNAGSILMANFVIADVVSAGSHASCSEVVITLAHATLERTAGITDWKIRRPILPAHVFGVTSENL